MKNFSTFSLLLFIGCVSKDTAVEYAERAHPECTDYKALNHRYNSGNSQKTGSQTEVQMTCDGQQKSITVKCIHGYGVINDTTCHENN
jgi:hypothetical protein